MNYSSEILNKIKERNDIVKIISEHVVLTSKGKDLVGVCPFHKGKSLTFSVEPEKQFYYCFGCKSGGNVFQFIMKIKNIGFTESIKYLADKSGFNLDEVNMEEQELLKQKDCVVQINRISGKYFYSQLSNQRESKVRKFFEENGISSHVIKKFGLGYSLNDWDSLYRFLVSKGCSDKDIELSGLILKSKRGNYIDRFRDRIMFPLFEGSGILTGFCGLSLDNTQAKYLFTPESSIFNKRASPFGLNIANKNSLKKIILFEGIFDVVLANQNNLDWCVALPYYLIDETNINLLKDFTEGVIIPIYNHTLLKEETLEMLYTLQKNSHCVKILKIPNDKNMREIICEKKEMVGTYIENDSKPLADYLIEDAIDNEKQKGLGQQTLRIINSIIDILSKFGNDIEWEVNSLVYSSKYGVSYEAFIGELRKRRKGLKEIQKRNLP